jgi:hypothetical protein
VKSGKWEECCEKVARWLRVSVYLKLRPVAVKSQESRSCLGNDAADLGAASAKVFCKWLISILSALEIVFSDWFSVVLVFQAFFQVSPTLSFLNLVNFIKKCNCTFNIVMDSIGCVWLVACVVGLGPASNVPKFCHHK